MSHAEATDPESVETPPVPIAEQVIVNFDAKFARESQSSTIEALLPVVKKLEDEGTELLKLFVAASSRKEAFFAMAVVRIVDPDLTFEALQQKPAFSGDARFERNAPVGLDDFDDPRAGEQWALERLGAVAPWTGRPAAGKTIVAIVDSGLYRADGTVHADLGAVEPRVDCQPQPIVVGGITVFPGLHVDSIDRDGHGTLLAGTIAAVPDNARGIASAVPGPWNVSLLPVKFFGPAVGPNAADAAIAIAHAVDKGAKVINLSWHVAGADPDLQVLRRALRLARDNDRLVVISAGNNGTDNEIYPTWPARIASEAGFKGRVLTVLASGRDDAKADFSNYGAGTVDLAAPGTGILTTGLYLEAPPRYAEYSGTSPAAAFGSAAAALVFALNPAWKPADVVQHLGASAVTVDTLRLACVGGRRLHIARAVHGPLRLLSPGAGDELPAGVAAPIAWSNRYANPKFANVRIEYHDGSGWRGVRASTPNDGLYGAWKPPAATPAGRIRITPVGGNFPVVSEAFRVV